MESIALGRDDVIVGVDTHQYEHVALRSTGSELAAASSSSRRTPTAMRSSSIGRAVSERSRCSESRAVVLMGLASIASSAGAARW